SMGDELVEEGQRLLVGPVQVFQEDHRRLPRRQLLEIAEEVSASRNGQLARTEQAGDGAAGPEVEPQPMPDDVSLVRAKVGGEAGTQLVGDRRRRIAVENSETVGDEVP